MTDKPTEQRDEPTTEESLEQARVVIVELYKVIAALRSELAEKEAEVARFREELMDSDEEIADLKAGLKFMNESDQENIGLLVKERDHYKSLAGKMAEALKKEHMETHDSTVRDEENQNCEICKLLWREA